MEKLKKIVKSDFALAGFILFATALTLSIMGGFCYAYGTNDDYTISVLLSSGDDRVLFISYYLSFIMSKLHKICNGINIYGISQIVLCAASLLAINYVLVRRMKKPLGALVSAFVDVFFYSTSVLVVQFTQTTALACTAGVLLFVYASFYPQGRKLTLFWKISAWVLVIFGSFYRIDSFMIVALFSFFLLFCLVFGEAARDGSNEKWYKKAAAVLKARLRFIISLALIFAVGFGLNFISDAIKRADENYRAYEEEARGRSLVTDYPLASYSENVGYYADHGVLSVTELYMINHGHVDREVLNAKTMNEIGEYSQDWLYKGDSKPVYAIKKNIETAKPRFECFIRHAYGKVISYNYIGINNKVFALIAALLGAAAVTAAIVLYRKARKERGISQLIYGSVPLIIMKLLLVAAWWAYFIVYWLRLTNSPMLICCAAALLTLRSANFRHTLYCWIFSFFTIALYCYQVWFRLNFRSTLSFVVPAFFFLLYLFEWENMEGHKGAKLTTNGFFTVAALALTIPFITNLIPLTWKEVYVVKTGRYPKTAYDYFEAHHDKTYATMIPYCLSIDPNYNNSLLQPDMPDNTITYACWNMYSESNERILREKGIENVFRDSIDNDNLYLVAKPNANYPKLYGIYLSNHYAEKGKLVRLEQVDRIIIVGEYLGGIKQGDSLAVYKVTQYSK